MLPVDGRVYKISVEGLQKAVADLKRLGHKFNGSAHNRNAISAAGGVLKRQIEANVPHESKTLKSNIRVRIMRKKGTREFAAVVGARRKVKQRASSATKQAVRYTRQGRARRITPAQALRAQGRVDYRVPSRYLHLVERGTRAHRMTTEKRTMVSAAGQMFGRGVNNPGAKSQYPVVRAVRAKGQAAMQAAIEKLKSALKQEVAKNG